MLFNENNLSTNYNQTFKQLNSFDYTSRSIGYHINLNPSYYNNVNFPVSNYVDYCNGNSYNSYTGYNNMIMNTSLINNIPNNSRSSNSHNYKNLSKNIEVNNFNNVNRLNNTNNVNYVNNVNYNNNANLINSNIYFHPKIRTNYNTRTIYPLYNTSINNTNNNDNKYCNNILNLNVGTYIKYTYSPVINTNTIANTNTNTNKNTSNLLDSYINTSSQNNIKNSNMNLVSAYHK